MRTLVYQAQDKGCGFATIKMALIHVSKDKRYAFLAEPRVEIAPGLDSLLSYAFDQGLILRAYEATDPTELLQNTEFPLLILLREEGGLHMALLHSRRGGRFLLLDPAKGRRRLKGEELLSVWTGQFLRIEGYRKKGEPPTIRALQSSHQSWLLLSFALLPMAFLLAGFSFLDHALPLPATLIAFLLSLASSMGQKFYLLGAMDRFDRKYMDGVDAKSLKRRRDLYVHFHAYKRAAFVSKSEVFGHLATVVAALIFFLFHDAMLSACLALTVGVAVGIHLLFHPKLVTLAQKCEALEGTYFFALIDAPRRKELRDELKSSSRKYGGLLSLSQSLLIALSVALALLFCLLQGVFSAQIILFYSFGAVYLALETEHLFHSYSLLEQKRKEEPYFLLNIASRT